MHHGFSRKQIRISFRITGKFYPKINREYLKKILLKMKICLIVDNPIKICPFSFFSKKIKDKKVFLINFYQFFEILLINPDIVILNHVRAVYWPIIKILKKKK